MSDTVKVLFIGDIFGEPGRKVVSKFVPMLRQKHGLDFVVANGENMAGGFGITPDTYQEMVQSGVDVITGGNHTFDKRDGYDLIQEDLSCVRPANFPAGTPGRGSLIATSTKGKKLGVINAMGRTFMDPLECPFRAVDALLPELKAKTNVILVDFHAEASSEKVAMGWHCDGRASFVVGTHTHVQTADERSLPGGPGYLTDAGMTGPYDSVIGIKKEVILEKFITKLKAKKFEPASGDPWLSGVIFEADINTGKTLRIERVRIELNRPETHPVL